MQTKYVTASELAEYIYCQCCWADTQEGLRETTAAMEQGSLEHVQVQKSLYRLEILKRLAIFLIGLSVLLLLGVVFIIYYFHYSL